eukprot:gnl/TRDRNA2_/TRDRNA2_119432_c2_seq1.p1 gnl/TRDRNA2_/TRDRNA2_119432_c2~~gnl/TRDRNA2_/TRDRNA2_119432_c2_seq1.p1  ORF type:complete len:132 (-),score=21.87 gnl/TRDRNA2_/TRDRNA2_119432_c2_seq1:105-476(-)
MSLPGLKTLGFQPGSSLVICSDGVWNQLSPEEVAMTCQIALERKWALGGDQGCAPAARERVRLFAEKLVRMSHTSWLAMRVGDVNDITALVVEILPDSELSSTMPSSAASKFSTSSGDSIFGA